MTQNLSTKVIVESLLFAAPEPLTIARLAGVLDVVPEEVDAALRELQTEYAQRGIRLQRDKGLVQLVTVPEAAAYVERLLDLDLSARLSTAALEALGIVAYRQPVTRAQIEAVRGVSSDGVLRTLLSHGLIEECGRLEQAGRPILYQTTLQFLQHFGLTDLEQLPRLDSEEVAGEKQTSHDDKPAVQENTMLNGLGSFFKE